MIITTILAVIGGITLWILVGLLSFKYLKWLGLTKEEELVLSVFFAPFLLMTLIVYSFVRPFFIISEIRKDIRIIKKKLKIK
jgi:hypothetical protein